MLFPGRGRERIYYTPVEERKRNESEVRNIDDRRKFREKPRRFHPDLSRKTST